MGFFSLSIPILLFASSLSLPPVSAAADTLTPGESISGNQTLVSAGGAFALGFFSPPGESVSGNRYLGTWYNTISNRTVVWVANRERPLIDPAGVFTVSDDRNLAVLDSNGSVIWSSAVDGVPSGTVAVLLDSGNLVLRQGDGRGLWQSFDHPTDTLLPGMKMGLNLRTGVAQRMVAWRAAGDPSPGAFSFGVDPRTTLQVITWRGSEPYWRSHVWNGWSSSSVRRINATAALYVLTYSRGSREASLAFSQTEVSAPARYVLEPTGTLKTLVWVEAMGYWGEAWSRPSMFCDPYNQCGPSGTCDSSGDPPTCRCLQGFVPRNQREWDRENYSGGCVRRVQLRCDRGDKFLRAERMKLPDRFTLVGNRTEGQCQAECLDSCRCTAYTYAKVREGPDSSRCLLWVGDLVDLEMVALGGEGLNVRLVASELVTDAQTDGSSGKNRSLMLILLPSLAAGVLLLGFLGYFLKRRIEKQRKRQISEFGYLNCSNTQVNKDTTEPPLMYFSTILAATNNFSAANKLGEGGFGPVYKGVLNTGQQIAIKRLSKDSGQGEEEFKNEVALIAKLQHRNLVRLLGSCIHGNERILIYEYLPNYSLDFFIFDATKQVQLDWARRFNIIKGIARGLMYLHQDSRFKIVHRDLKASNILLDEDMNPKISDFGMARIFGGDQNQARTNRVIGTYGYMSPEYAMRGLFSVRSDVYSFGVLLLEIISGQRNISFHLNDVFLNLLTYAWQLWEEDKVMLLLDASISQTSSLAEVSRCVHVGLLCVQDHVDERPAMSSVVFMLENDTAIHDKPKRPMFMLERSPWKRELQRGSPGSISVNSLTNTMTQGR